MGDKRLVLFIDSGDTLVDEGTQVWNDDEVVISTGLIDGAEAALRQIHSRGYRIALVADGKERSFDNVYRRQYGLRSCFEGWIVSETLGVSKPAREMFQGALDALGLGPEDKGRIVMAGNNLGRDVRGANLFGIVSVWLDWSPRYPREGRDEYEIPDYTIHSPAELPALLERLNEALLRGEPIKRR